MASLQEIISGIVLCADTQALEIPLPVQHHALKASALQGEVEVRRTAHILVGIDAIVPIRLVEGRGTFLIVNAGMSLVLD